MDGDLLTQRKKSKYIHSSSFKNTFIYQREQNSQTAINDHWNLNSTAALILFVFLTNR